MLLRTVRARHVPRPLGYSCWLAGYCRKKVTLNLVTTYHLGYDLGNEIVSASSSLGDINSLTRVFLVY
jgi:hypothetical protein